MSATVTLILGARASAQTTSCQPSGRASIDVSFTAPDAGETVSGNVRISGAARSPLLGGDDVTVVQVWAGNEVVGTSTNPEDDRTMSFSFVWDSSGATPGRVTLRAVACGDDGAWGEDRRTITVRPVTSTTTTDTGSPTTTTGGSATTTTTTDVDATSTTTSSTTSAPTSTTSTSTTTTTAVAPAADVDVDDGSGFAQLRGVRPPAAIRVSAQSVAGPPLYPAVAAGLAGMAGLVYAMARRPPARV